MLGAAPVGRPGTALAACAAMPKDKGQVTFSVDIPTTGTYRVWSRVYAPTAAANGFYMQIDQTVCKTVVGNGGPITAGKFTWVNWTDGDTSKIFSASLEKGKHTVVAAGLDANLSLDKVMFLTDTTCTPVDTGSNCDWTEGSASGSPSPSGSSANGTVSPTPNANGDIPGSNTGSTNNGSSQTSKQTGLVAGLVKYWPFMAAGVVLLIGVGSGAWYWRQRLFGIGHHQPAPIQPVPRGAMPVSATTNAPPAGSVIQPHDPNTSSEL